MVDEIKTEIELNDIMNKKETKEKIKKIAKEKRVNYSLAESMFRTTLRQMIENKEYWVDFEVIDSPQKSGSVST